MFVIVKNITLEQTLPMTDVMPIQTLTEAPLKNFIIRSTDRLRLTNSLQNITFCVNSFVANSIALNAMQRQQSGRFELIEDT